ncbi:Tenascin [Giardia duodenalis assemblage B]|uniref:Tenascin n=1 Tax=Giardia duodenalis assemblage B TaxID=1394984 RepID=A0A132NLS3_GIAIN|nr:Tenascin [Giardia intestinalis assemblage B]
MHLRRGLPRGPVRSPSEERRGRTGGHGEHLPLLRPPLLSAARCYAAPVQ